MTKKAVVWIREDFRIEENEALATATQNHEFVNALYIYNPINFDKKRNNNGRNVLWRCFKYCLGNFKKFY